MTTTKTVLAKTKAFSSDHSPKEHTLSVLPDGTVKVWDTVANIYTSCHSLTEGVMEKARNAKPYEVVS